MKKMENELFYEQIREVQNTMNTSYILKNNEMFYDIGFKVMQNQENGYLLQCYRLKYNGQVKLTYFTEEYISLEKALVEMEISKLENVLFHLCEACIQVENLGFLNLACVDNRLEKIFVDSNTNAIKLIYLPVNVVGIHKNCNTFESEIRSQLIKRMENVTLSDNPRIGNIIDVLKDGTLRLQDVGKKLQGTAQSYIAIQREEQKQNSVVQQNGIRIESLNTGIAFAINQPEYILGKSKERVNGEIPGNPAISRVHCKITCQGGKYYISDMGSANGTFVNGRRISQNEQAPIENGSRIKLANMEFIVRR